VDLSYGREQYIVMTVNICIVGLCSVEGLYFQRADGVSKFVDTFIFV